MITLVFSSMSMCGAVRYCNLNLCHIYTAARLQDRCDRVSTRACERFEAAQCVAVGAVRRCRCNDNRGFKASAANNQCLCQAGKTLNGTEGSEVACADG